MSHYHSVQNCPDPELKQYAISILSNPSKSNIEQNQVINQCRIATEQVEKKIVIDNKLMEYKKQVEYWILHSSS